MANALYNPFKQQSLDNSSAIDMDGDTIKATLIDSADYTFSATTSTAAARPTYPRGRRSGSRARSARRPAPTAHSTRRLSPDGGIGRPVPPLESSPAPNIVVIMADDDLNALNDGIANGWMPHLKSSIIDQGMTFANSFVADSLCCPSRATFLTGNSCRAGRPALRCWSMTASDFDVLTLRSWERPWVIEPKPLTSPRRALQPAG